MDNLEFLGMFCLGAFVGGVINYGLLRIKDSDAFLKVSVAIFGAAFSGAIFVFLEFLLKQADPRMIRSVFMYPVGLLMALLWLQFLETLNTKVVSDKLGVRILGWSHFVFLAAITLLLVHRIFFGPAIVH